VTAHLEEPAIVGPLASNKDRVDRRLEIVVDATGTGAFEKPERTVVRVKHHLLRLTRVGAHEQHAAVTQPQVRHLDRDGRAADQHNLVAPVELVGLARREAQRHIGPRRRRDLVAPPRPSISPHRVVAALVTRPAQRLEHPDQRQPLAAGPRLVGHEQLVQLIAPGAQARHRLLLPLVMEHRRLRPKNLADDFARHSQLTADRLDRLALDQIGTADPRDRLHHQHPKQAPAQTREPR
jgi:hypothetical protein